MQYVAKICGIMPRSHIRIKPAYGNGEIHSKCRQICDMHTLGNMRIMPRSRIRIKLAVNSTTNNNIGVILDILNSRVDFLSVEYLLWN